MRLLQRPRHYVTRRNLEVLALPRELLVSRRLPDLADDLESFLPALARLIGQNSEALQFEPAGRTPGAEVEPPVAKNIEHCGLLGRAHRMIIRKGQQSYSMPDAHFLSALSDCAIEHLRRRAMGILIKEMMLNGEEGLEPHLLRIF